jgi:lipopolysaccharide biosynthesis regulator YciM
VADQLESFTGEKMLLQKSHYRCELALIAKAEGRASDAAAQLKKAVNTNSGCVRAIHLRARFDADRGEYRAAIRTLRQAAEQDRDYLPEVLPEIVACYRQLGDLRGLRTYLVETVDAQPGVEAILSLVELIKEQEGEEAAADYLADQLAKAPSLRLLQHSIELNARMPEGQSLVFLESLRPHINRLLEDKPLYQCAHCGFAAKTLHWQCPSCRCWSTIKRKAGSEAEA